MIGVKRRISGRQGHPRQREPAAAPRVAGPGPRRQARIGSGQLSELLLGNAVPAWLLLGVAAFLVGLAKTSLGGLGHRLGRPLRPRAPARESTAALLLVLLVGDAVAVTLYRRDADWALIRSLLPGIVARPGRWARAVLAVADDAMLRRGIGVVLLALCACSCAVQRRGRRRAALVGPGPWRRSGVAAGFTTMVANAGGPVMALYLVGQGVPKRRFVGTAAWFFLGVNLAKLPFSVGLGLVAPSMLATTLLLAPARAGLGGSRPGCCWTGCGRDVFERAVLAASASSAIPLLLSLSTAGVPRRRSSAAASPDNTTTA